MTVLIASVRRARAVAALTLASAVGLGAQEPRRLAQPDSVPLALVTALVAAGGFGGEPQILVGELPGWVASRLFIPSSARILGSAFLGNTVVGILSTSDAPEEAIAALKPELEKRGWKTAPPAPVYGGGFRPAAMAPSAGPATRVTLCGDQQTLIASAARRRGATTDITIRVASSTGYTVCAPPPMPAGMARSPYPTLFNPANATEARQLGDCFGLMGSSGTNTTLRTSMDAVALLDHYAKQLRDSGWIAESASGSIIGRTWTRPDSAGVPVELSLTVATSPRDGACRELNLQARTLRKP